MIDTQIECQLRFDKEQEYKGIDKHVNKTTPLVSVTVATYQHTNFIRDCIEGILMQKTTFPIEIIIGEDGSTDGTREICIEYADKYPNLIRLFLRDRNTSQLYDENGKFICRFNGIWNRMSARGKYIAWCEGDDYWIDPLKLQKQVDFLESNPEYGFIHTNFSTSDGKRVSIDNYPKSDLYLSGFLSGNFSIGTLTVLYRRDLYDSLPKYYQEKKFKMGDLPLWIEFASISKIKYIPDITAMYRVLENSASHSSNIEKAIDFRKSSLEVKLFYIKKFELSELKNQALKSFYSGVVKLSYEKKNKEYAEKYYNILKRIDRPSLKTIIFFYGSKYKIVRYAINLIYEIGK